MTPVGEVDREPSRWEACGRSGADFGSFLTRARPASNRNRPVRTRTQGGVGPVAGSPSQSRGPDYAFSCVLSAAIEIRFSISGGKSLRSGPNC
jgi:hypothetical protein